MASRTRTFSALARASIASRMGPPRRTFTSSRPMLDTVVAAAPVKKPVGAFRGGLFGFLLGAVGAGSAMYYYVLQEYKISNELLTEDIYGLQTTVQRIEGYVKTLEEKVEMASKKK